MTSFVNALVHAELFLLGVPSVPPAQPVPAGDASTTISFSASDYRSAAG